VQQNQAEIVQQTQQKFLVSGVVDFSTLPELMKSASVIFQSLKKYATANVNANAETGITVDLSKITACNSAGLALILEMAKQAASDNVELHFENLPETLLTIAKAYGVEDEIRDFFNE
jgi:ABC-type transporter Mla MlaB component